MYVVTTIREGAHVVADQTGQPHWGAKVDGLIALPAEWTPPFVALSAHICQRTFGGASQAQLDGLVKVVLDTLDCDPETPLIVRSSASAEGLQHRGLLVSSVCNSDLASTMSAVWQECVSAASDSDVGDVSLICQLYVTPRLIGHLSNERIVSRRHDSWYFEVMTPEGELRTAGRITKSKGAGINRSDALRCDDEADLTPVLRIVATNTPTFGRGRRHYEWIWDGDRVWVVQSDPDETPEGEAPSALPESTVEIAPFESDVLKPAEEANERWRKTYCVQKFRDIGLQTAPLFVLDEPDILKKILSGSPPANLIEDLRRLTISPVVIRTDVDGADGHDVMLPRSGSCVSAELALDFLTTTVRQLHASDVASDQICFLFHRLIPARAGTYSYASPDTHRVRVDAIWGVPDGLFFLPHDSHDVDAVEGTVIESLVRCKPTYVRATSDGAWKRTRTGYPNDWASVLADENLFKIAEQSLLIARTVKGPVEVMHFVDTMVDGTRTEVLPWFFQAGTPFDRLPSVAPRLDPFRAVIRTPADLEALRRQANGIRRVTSLLVSADPAWLRSTEFLVDVANAAKELNLRVVLEGSALAHARYVLQRQGIEVEFVDPLQPFGPSTERHFNKLVRDSIPSRIESGGERVVTQRATSTQLSTLLREKLVEEAFEVADADNEEQLLGELADVLEVLEAICAVAGIEVDRVRAIQASKADESGRFKEGLILRNTYVDDVVSPVVRREAPLPEHQVLTIGSPSFELDVDGILVRDDLDIELGVDVGLGTRLLLRKTAGGRARLVLRRTERRSEYSQLSLALDVD